jgi:hypothetical protein
MAATVAETLREEHQKEIDVLTEFLASGKCQTLEVYKEKCGEIRGLRRALSQIDALQRLQEEDDD